jgi:hypothetical protein
MIRNSAFPNVLRICLCLSIFSSGCGSKSYNTAPVSGKVTLDGKPVPGALVSFTPLPVDGKTPGPVSTGRCDDEGRYSLATINGEIGAVVGNHRVSIFSYSPKVAPGPDEVQEIEKFPMRFNTRTRLTSEVTETGLEDENFDLSTR